MPRPRDFAIHASFYLIATLSGIAAAYVLNQWVRHWWDAPHTPDIPDDEPKSTPTRLSQQNKPSPDAAPLSDPKHADPNSDPHTTHTHSDLPPLRTHSLPPPVLNGRALLTGSSLGSNPEAMTSSVSLHTSDGFEDDNASQATTSDADTEPFVDILSPSPTHVITRRRSLRNHDLFAASHISFSELGNLVAPQNESH